MKKKQIGILGIAAIMLVSSLTVMVGNAITPALPQLGEVYGLGNYASWLVTAPALGVVATAIFFGRLIDRRGAYPVAVGGLFFYGLLGIAGGFMPNAAALFIDRFLLGAATAAIMNTSVALISVFFHGEKQLRLLSIQGMAMEFGGIIFLSVSGVLAETSWRSPFFIYGLGFVALAGILLCVPRPGQQEGAQDDESGTPETGGAKGVPLGLVLLVAFLGMLMFFTAMVSLPIYLQNTLGMSPSFTGYYLSALDLVAVLAAGLMPNVVKRIREKGCLTAAFFFYGAAFLMYYLLDGFVALWAAACFVGVGFGLSTPLFNSLVVNKSTPQNKGLNISFCTMAMFGGQFFSALLVSAFVEKNIFLAASVIALVIMAAILPVAGWFHNRR